MMKCIYLRKLLLTKMNKFVILICFVLCYTNVTSQTPATDASWQLIFSDEFNFNSNGNQPWLAQRDYLFNQGWHLGWVGDETWINIINKDPKYSEYWTTDGRNHELAGGLLKLTLRKEDEAGYAVQLDSLGTMVIKKFPFTTGKLHMYIEKSEEIDSDYGYYEMRFRVPYDTLQTVGIQTNFWAFGVNDSVSYCEIDFYEMNGKGQWFTHNIHHHFKDEPTHPRAYESVNITTFDPIKTSGLRPEDYHYRRESEYIDTRDSNGFHIIGCEVLPNKVNFYMDNRLIRSVESNDWFRVKYLSVMQMEVNAIVPTGFYDGSLVYDGTSGKPNINTVFPYTLDIDYIRFYKMPCSAKQIKPIISPSTFDPDNYTHEVVRSIYLGDGGNSNNIVSAGDNITLRSEGIIEMNDGFTVEAGANFYATNCNCED